MDHQSYNSTDDLRAVFEHDNHSLPVNGSKTDDVGAAWSTRQLEDWTRAMSWWSARPLSSKVRSEEGRVGKEWVRTFSTRWSAYHERKNQQKKLHKRDKKSK